MNTLVSSDIDGDPHGAIVDLSLTKVIDGDLCAVYSWYDNEFGFANASRARPQSGRNSARGRIAVKCTGNIGERLV